MTDAITNLETQIQKTATDAAREGADLATARAASLHLVTASFPNGATAEQVAGAVDFVEAFEAVARQGAKTEAQVAELLPVLVIRAIETARQNAMVRKAQMGRR